MVLCVVVVVAALRVEFPELLQVFIEVPERNAEQAYDALYFPKQQSYDALDKFLLKLGEVRGKLISSGALYVDPWDPPEVMAYMHTALHSTVCVRYCK